MVGDQEQRWVKVKLGANSKQCVAEGLSPLQWSIDHVVSESPLTEDT